MIFYIFLFVLLLICLYLGQVFGLMIYCDNCKEFHEAKRYVYIIPLLKIVLWVPLIKDCIKSRQWKMLGFYILMGDKSVMILCTIVELLPELHRQQQRAMVRNMQRQQKSSIVRFARSVLFETHEDCVAYNVKFM